MEDDSSQAVLIFDNLTRAQWAIGGGGVVLLIFVLIVNCCFKNHRWRAIQAARSGLITAEFLTLRDLPKHAYQLIAEEAFRERQRKVLPPWKDDCGWGAPGTEYDGVHFKTLIASSVHILEAHALKRDPSLKACLRIATERDSFSKSQLACDVEEYLERIRVALNGELDRDLCSQYLAFHRNARTPGRQCTEQEYRAFLTVFQEILRRVER